MSAGAGGGYGRIWWAAAAIAASAVWAQAPAQEPPGAAFTRVRAGLCTLVELNGIGPYPFLIDAAMPGTVVGRDVAAYLQPGASDSEIALVAPLRSLVLAETFVPCGETRVVDLSGFARQFGMPIAGIVGVWHAGFALTLDFPSQRLWLTELADTETQGPQPPENRTPSVRGVLNDKTLLIFDVDTTFAGTLGLPERLLREWSALREDSPVLEVEPVPGSETPLAGSRQVRLGSLRIGPAYLAAPICEILPEGTPPRIGLSFLEHFRVTFARGAPLRIESPLPGPFREGDLNGCGATPVRLREGYWELAVAKNSPAARGGLTSGALLIAVDGEDAGGLSWADAAEALAGAPETPIALTVRRGGREQTVELVCERLL